MRSTVCFIYVLCEWAHHIDMKIHYLFRVRRWSSAPVLFQMLVRRTGLWPSYMTASVVFGFVPVPHLLREILKQDNVR